MGSRAKFLVLIAVFFVLLGSVVIMAILPPLVTGSVIDRHVSFRDVYTPAEFGLEAVELTLNTADDQRLAAWLVAAEHPQATVIFLGGLNEPSVTAFFGHAGFLAQYGYASLLVELRAHGASSGQQVSLGYAEHLDVLAGLNYLRSELDYAGLPIIAFGVDLGGAAAINAAGLYPGLAGVISIGTFSSWADLFGDNLYFSGAPLALALLERPFVRLYTLLKFGFKNRALYPQRQIARLGGRPALLMHAKEDEFIPVLNLERLMLAAPAEVESWIRPGPEHLVCSDFLHPERDPEYARRVLDFLERHFSMPREMES